MTGTYYKYYHYDPSLAAACVFAILFGLTTVWHAYTLARNRSWYFIPVVVGGIFEIVGYAARGVSHSEAPHLAIGPYVIQTLLLLIAPPLFAASMYMMLGRIIVGVDGEAYSLVKRRWLTKVFVISDVICFFVQLGGAALMASTNPNTSTTGSHVVLAGLIVQIIIFGFFVTVAMVFHRRIKTNPTRHSKDNSVPWEKFLNILYFTSGLILVRNIVRVVEFVQGFEGYIILHEMFLYVFDGIPMAAVMYIFNIWHPSTLSNQFKLSRVEQSENSDIEI